MVVGGDATVVGDDVVDAATPVVPVRKPDRDEWVLAQPPNAVADAKRNAPTRNLQAALR
jgi:hypothetical protein